MTSIIILLTSLPLCLAIDIYDKICIDGLEDETMNGIYTNPYADYFFLNLSNHINYTSSFLLWEYSNDDGFDSYELSFSENVNTWMFHDSLLTSYVTPTINNSIMYCRLTNNYTLTNDYSILISDADSPSNSSYICDDWIKNKYYYYNITLLSSSFIVTTNISKCDHLIPTSTFTTTSNDTNEKDVLKELEGLVSSFGVLDFLIISWICLVMLISTILIVSQECAPEKYPATRLKTYKAILFAKGYDPTAPRSKSDKREIVSILLKRDIILGKVVWHGTYWKDFLCFLRMNHSLFSIFYGSDFDPFGQR